MAEAASLGKTSWMSASDTTRGFRRDRGDHLAKARHRDANGVTGTTIWG